MVRVSVGKLHNGGVPEWLKGTDCKSVGYAYVGSNPTPSTTFARWLRVAQPERLGRSVPAEAATSREDGLAKKGRKWRV